MQRFESSNEYLPERAAAVIAEFFTWWLNLYNLHRLLLGQLGEVRAQVESRLESMGQRAKLKLQHANRERLRAESEALQSREAMSSMATRTDAAVAAHEARERMEQKAREEAENKCQQLTLDLEWQKHSQEQVCSAQHNFDSRCIARLQARPSAIFCAQVNLNLHTAGFRSNARTRETIARR